MEALHSHSGAQIQNKTPNLCLLPPAHPVPTPEGHIGTNTPTMCLCMCAVKGNSESAVYNSDTTSHATTKSVDAGTRRMTSLAGQHFSRGSNRYSPPYLHLLCELRSSILSCFEHSLIFIKFLSNTFLCPCPC